MATYDIPVTTEWTKVADDGDDPILVQCLAKVDWKAAAVATDAAPTVNGHELYGKKDLISRDNLGAGFVYVCVLGTDATITFAVSK